MVTRQHRQQIRNALGHHLGRVASLPVRVGVRRSRRLDSARGDQPCQAEDGHVVGSLVQCRFGRHQDLAISNLPYQHRRSADEIEYRFDRHRVQLQRHGRLLVIEVHPFVFQGVPVESPGDPSTIEQVCHHSCGCHVGGMDIDDRLQFRANRGMSLLLLECARDPFVLQSHAGRQAIRRVLARGLNTGLAVERLTLIGGIVRPASPDADRHNEDQPEPLHALMVTATSPVADGLAIRAGCASHYSLFKL